MTESSNLTQVAIEWYMLDLSFREPMAKQSRLKEAMVRNEI